MRIFDCFTFYNEFDLLELRLQELWNIVDYFVIAEADITHQNNPKSFNLRDNWHNFQQYSNKIRYIMISDMPHSDNTWINEGFQRTALSRGLNDLQPDDVVIVSDIDEIPRPSAIKFIKEDENNHDRYILGMPICYFKFNYMMVQPVYRQNNIKIVRGRAFTNPNVERATFDQIPGIIKIEHGGWHFTYFGSSEFAQNKLRNFAHAESNIPKYVDNLDINFMIVNKIGLGKFDSNEKFEYVKVDDYFPQTILNNLVKYKDMIVPDAMHSVYDFYSRA
jgi:hypothetical protein